MCESRRQGVRLKTPIVCLLELHRRDVADRFEQAPVVEAINPLQCSEFDGFDIAPGTATINDLGFLQPVDRLSQGVVVRVAGAVDRRLDAAFGKPLTVANRQVLGAAVAVVDQPIDIAAGGERLLERIEHEVRLHRGAHPPANNHAREHIDHKGDEHRTAPDGHIREVCHPQLVRPLRRKLTIDQICRPRGCLIASSAIVVLNPLPRTTPRSPRSRIGRRTVQRATRIRSRLSCFQVLRTP